VTSRNWPYNSCSSAWDSSNPATRFSRRSTHRHSARAVQGSILARWATLKGMSILKSSKRWTHIRLSCMMLVSGNSSPSTGCRHIGQLSRVSSGCSESGASQRNKQFIPRMCPQGNFIAISGFAPVKKISWQM